MKELTLGSLFDGSGGFPLAAKIAGIKPVWASEVELFPIRVTTKRLPEIKHLGDIRNINGKEIEPVDIITFGSPCQDLSIAGKRDGLKGSKSNLFFEAIRIIKEMRKKTNDTKPRYIIWENVTGAFSSNKGEDFRRVLDEIIGIKGSYPKVPIPYKGKWAYKDIIMADGFSLAYRVLDAQYFGVPQRRRRIFLVADFNGTSAKEILFDKESLPWNFKKSKTKEQRNTRNIEDCFGETICINDQGGERMDIQREVSGTLKAKGGIPPLVFENHGQDTRFKGPINKSQTLSSSLGTGGNNQPFVVYDIRQTSENTKNKRHNIYKSNLSRTIDTGGNNPTRNQGGMAIVNKDILSMSKNSYFTQANKNITSSLVATDYKDPPLILNKFVRRLTPKECGRLQGFPDYWCDDLETENPTREDMEFWRKVFDEDSRIRNLKKRKTDEQIKKWLKNPYSDSSEYKMWGNGIALPCVVYIFNNLLDYLSKLSDI
ncbi:MULTISPECIES: DNA cytosine methyltransferase [Helcococcus]|uniref:DNA (cytosine-5-)-methyltransferase n=1 Tax=Helcococcus bovis TaxID=3153252 RepID=A0ABW9F5P7_9FIRM